MRRLWLLIVLLAASLCVAQETKRPTVEVDPGLVYGSSYMGQALFPNAYDAGGTGTSSANVVNGLIGGVDTEEMGDMFTTWETPSGSYSALTLSVMSTCVTANGAGCYIDYSTNGGSTWLTLRSGGGWAGQTNTVTLSPSQNMAQLRVRVSLLATDDATSGTTGRATLRLYDVWTSGTLAAASTKRWKVTTE